MVKSLVVQQIIIIYLTLLKTERLPDIMSIYFKLVAMFVDSSVNGFFLRITNFVSILFDLDLIAR